MSTILARRARSGRREIRDDHFSPQTLTDTHGPLGLLGFIGLVGSVLGYEVWEKILELFVKAEQLIGLVGFCLGNDQ